MMPLKMAEAIVATHPDISVTADKVQKVTEALFSYIIDQTKKNNKVNFPNFLKFERVKRAERSFKNPNKLGEGVSIVKPERYALVVSVMGNTKKDFEEIEISDEVPVPETTEVDGVVVAKPKKVKKSKTPVTEGGEGTGEAVEGTEGAAAPTKKKSSKAKKTEAIANVNADELTTEPYVIDHLSS